MGGNFLEPEMKPSSKPGTRILTARVVAILAGIGFLFCSACNRTVLADDPQEMAQYEPPPPPAEPYQSNALVERESSPSSVDWMEYEGKGAEKTHAVEEPPTSIGSDAQDEIAILSEPLRPLEPPQQIAQAEFPPLPETIDESDRLPEYGDLYGEASRIPPDSGTSPSATAPALTETAAQELARSVFDAVEGRDRTAFLQVVSSIDAETVWGKVTREKGEWEVDAKPTGPTEVAVSTRFRARGAEGVFEKTYRWQLQWYGGWKVVEWKR
jgi:hypothetical protein